MDEETAREIKELKAELREAKADLARASTPRQEKAAEGEIRKTRRDLRDVVDELRADGNTREAERLEEYIEEQAYEKHRARTDRYMKERGIEFVDGDGDDETDEETDDETDNDKEPPKAKRNNKREPPVEKPPPSTHFVDRPLFGRKDRG